MTLMDNGLWASGVEANSIAIDQNGAVREVTTFGAGGPETRPRNVSALACIWFA
jgi:hypothetical protein